MATTNSSSAQRRSQSRVNSSAVGPRAGANSAANSGRPSAWAQPNTANRLFGAETTASTSSRPSSGDDARQVARDPTNSPRRGASGPHNPTAPGLSSSNSSALFVPRITESPSTTTSPQSDDRGTDRASHRVAKRTVLEGESPYSSSSKSRNGSVAELHELRAGANSAANSSQPPTSWVRPDPTSRPFAPQTTTSKSSRPTADDDAERVAQYPTDSPRRGASGGSHNAIAPALVSSSQSSAPFAPRITESSSTTTSPRSDDRVADRASQRVAKRTVPEGGSPYSSSTRMNGSAVEPHEHVADANSAANSGQPLSGRPNPTSPTFAPQTTASESSHSATGEDAGQIARNQTDSPRRGAGGQHNPTAPALSSSKSSALFAPRITESASTTTLPQSDDRASDRETHRVARTGLEGQSPYSNASKSRNGSVAELHELRAGANSAAYSSQPPTTWGRSDPTSRTFVPQTKASESSRLAAGDDTGQVARYPTDVPGRGAGGLYSSVAASSSKSSLSRVTQRGDATPDFTESSPPASVNGKPRTETNLHASKKPPRSSKLRVDNPAQGERAAHKANQLRKANSNISESSQNIELSSTPAGQQDKLSPTPSDPQGERTTYQADADPPRGAHSNISKSQNVDPPSGAHTHAVQPVDPSSPSDAQGEKVRCQAKVDLPRGANSNGGAQTSVGQQESPAQKNPTRENHAKVPLRPENSKNPASQNVDLSAVHPSSGQQAPPPPSKDPPASEGPLAASEPRLTQTRSSRRTQDTTAPGAAPRVGTPPEVPDVKGGHDPLNGPGAPNDMSSPHAADRPVTPGSSVPTAPQTEGYQSAGVSNRGGDPQNLLRNPSTQVPRSSGSNAPMRPTPQMVVSPQPNDAIHPQTQQQGQSMASNGAKDDFCHKYCSWCPFIS